MRVKRDFFSRGTFKIGNDKTTRFWEDVWLGEISLTNQYPSLYSIDSIVQGKNVSVNVMMSQYH
jgi:hypothetical protein